MKLQTWLAGLCLLGLAQTTLAHDHCNVGALNQSQGSPLIFQNGSDRATNSGYALLLDYDTSGDPYTGRYATTDINNLSFTAINLGANIPAAGAQVRLRFVSLEGPAGGSFQVWDVTNFFAPGDFNEEGNDANMIGFSIPVGTTNGTNSILLSANNGEPGAFPGGHIHGRQYSATKLGLYKVTVQAYDNSRNGPGGGPIHSPSELLTIYFQAGTLISALSIGESQADVSFATQFATDYYLESTPDLADSNGWQTVAGPASGNNNFQVLTDPNPNAGQSFYRLRTQPTPQ